MVKIKVANTSELEPGKMMGLDIRGHQILLVNLDGTFHAVDGRCTHMMGKLWEGSLVRNVVKCPRHGAEYDVTTGKALKNPWLPLGKAKDLNLYQVMVEGDEVFMEIEE
jgi:3-phenylpropionate/trans-cinnamate dioxygenase ferredoxin subunit